MESIATQYFFQIFFNISPKCRPDKAKEKGKQNRSPRKLSTRDNVVTWQANEKQPGQNSKQFTIITNLQVIFINIPLNIINHGAYP